MRIISGKFKARRFSVPKAFPSRPTTDFAKEGLFNILENQLDLYDLRILDLCSGTGNISFEFLSREAGNVIAVDQNSRCLRHISETAKQLGITSGLTTIKEDIVHFIERTEETFDLIFADPPYAYNKHAELVQAIYQRSLLNPGAWLIVEHGRDTKLNELPNFEFVRSYGNVYFSFFTKDTQ